LKIVASFSFCFTLSPKENEKNFKEIELLHLPRISLTLEKLISASECVY
jgi:hypothetical protein